MRQRDCHKQLGTQMTIIEQLKAAIEAYEGPLPAIGNSPDEIWLREAFKHLLALEQTTRNE
jgi:hypothetical protein